MRSFLTILGIVIGVMTVIAMVSIIQGLNRSFLRELESVGSDLIIVAKFEPGAVFGRRPEEERQRKDLTFDDAMALKSGKPPGQGRGRPTCGRFFRGHPRSSTKTSRARNPSSWAERTVSPGPFGLSTSEGPVPERIRCPPQRQSLRAGVRPGRNPLSPYQRRWAKKSASAPEHSRSSASSRKEGQMFGQSQDNFVGHSHHHTDEIFPL